MHFLLGAFLFNTHQYVDEFHYRWSLDLRGFRLVKLGLARVYCIYFIHYILILSLSALVQEDMGCYLRKNDTIMSDIFPMLEDIPSLALPPSLPACLPVCLSSFMMKLNDLKTWIFA